MICLNKPRIRTIPEKNYLVLSEYLHSDSSTFTTGALVNKGYTILKPYNIENGVIKLHVFCTPFSIV